MTDWTLVGHWWHGPDGERLREISGSEGGAGAGAGAEAGGGGAASALGGMSNIDFTFGQKGVYDDRTKKELQMLMQLMGASAGAGSKTVNQGQTPGASPVATWNPAILQAMLHTFAGGGKR